MGVIVKGFLMNLHTLIYVSRSTCKVSSESLGEIAKSSASRNEVIGVTGLLLYGSGKYFQLLEGGMTATRSLYRRISMDPRHEGFQMLFESPIPDRLFPDWHMGQLNLDDPDVNQTEFWSQAEAKELDHIEGVSPHIKSLALIRGFIDHHGQVPAWRQGRALRQVGLQAGLDEAQRAGFAKRYVI